MSNLFYCYYIFFKALVCEPVLKRKGLTLELKFEPFMYIFTCVVKVNWSDEIQAIFYDFSL